jgi:haloacetate dehalogenase
MFDGFRRAAVTVDGVSIAYVIGGSGPPLLMLHGFPQNLAMWAKVAPRLAARFTVVCADLRGYGDSSKPRCLPDCSNYSFRAFATDQRALMDRLGFSRFHIVGHDRGGRTGHRMALDHPQAVASLTVMDIVPTHAMFSKANSAVGQAYWHWYFLAQPEPFPERLIGSDPDYFYETCLTGWGAASVADFDEEMLASYRRTWRDPACIHGMCSDYRAAGGVDFQHDAADLEKKIQVPVLAFYGSRGVMARLFDLPAEWRLRCSSVTEASLPGGHFFVDQFPDETSKILSEYLAALPL